MVEEKWDLGLYNKNRLIPLRMDQISNKYQFKDYFWMHYYTHYANKMLYNMVTSIVSKASLFWISKLILIMTVWSELFSSLSFSVE